MSVYKFVFPNLSKKRAASAWDDAKHFTQNCPRPPELEAAFARILDEEMSKPNLGCATTGEMLTEIQARVDLNYSTVFYEPPKPPTTSPNP